METQETNSPLFVAAVRFTRIGKLYHFDCRTLPDMKAGDYVIADTARGRYLGQVMGFVDVKDPDQKYRPILRIATPRDMLLSQQWEAKQDDALAICQEKAEELGHFTDVKFVAARYNYDGSALTFLLTAEQKVDVSELWDELKRIFQSQIEMRQVGPRDVAKLLGGYGACGELRCCCTFLTEFHPISIKMAKMQDISLNPSEITGMCGRLRCCLIYEYEQYVEARKQLPKRNRRVGTPLGLGRVVEVHPLQDAVTVKIEEQDDAEGQRHLFQREELIPLEEYEALREKMKQPCHERNDEPGKRDDSSSRSHSGVQSEARERQDQQVEDQSQQSKRSSSKRRGRRRGQRQRDRSKREQDQS